MSKEISKENFIILLTELTSLTDELNIIYTYYKDEYLYFIWNIGRQYMTGIYDYLPDLPKDRYLIKRRSVLLICPYNEHYNGRSFYEYFNFYDENNNRWIITYYTQCSKKSFEKDYGILIVDELSHPTPYKYDKINTLL